MSEALTESLPLFETVGNHIKIQSFGPPEKLAIRAVVEAIKNASYSSAIVEADVVLVSFTQTENGWSGIAITTVSENRFYEVEYVHGDRAVSVNIFRKQSTDNIQIF